MRTTVNISDGLFDQAKAFAASSRRTMTSLIEEGLRRVLDARTAGRADEAIGLPTHSGGSLRPGIDLADNAGVRDALDERT